MTRRRYEYKVIDTGEHLEDELNSVGRLGWLVVGVTTKKQLFIAPPQANILMREVQPEAEDGYPRSNGRRPRARSLSAAPMAKRKRSVTASLSMPS